MTDGLESHLHIYLLWDSLTGSKISLESRNIILAEASLSLRSQFFSPAYADQSLGGLYLRQWSGMQKATAKWICWFPNW